MKVREVAKKDSRFFLKSVYGPLSDDWPTLSFTRPQFETALRKVYRPESDFVLFSGTTNPKNTSVEEHRGRLLSMMSVSLAKVEQTQDFVPPDIWNAAQKTNPGQWGLSFGVLDGWRFAPSPMSSDIVPRSVSVMGQYPNVGGVKEIDSEERNRLLDLDIEKLSLRIQATMRNPLTLQQLQKDAILNAVTVRLAELIQNRVDASGSIQTRTKPMRTAPARFELLQKIAEILSIKPLRCPLCGGVIPLQPSNRMLQPSADRIDSSSVSYGPENFQIAHLACNLAKNSSSATDFDEWLATAVAASVAE